MNILIFASCFIWFRKLSVYRIVCLLALYWCNPIDWRLCGQTVGISYLNIGNKICSWYSVELILTFFSYLLIFNLPLYTKPASENTAAIMEKVTSDTLNMIKNTFILLQSAKQSFSHIYICVCVCIFIYFVMLIVFVKSSYILFNINGIIFICWL